ncbi:MAG: AraC family transcriptional regulator [Methylophilaceae bacterium]
MRDRLAGFFEHYNFSTHVFYSGTLCEDEAFDDKDGMGHLHLIRKGPITVYASSHSKLTINEPSLLFYPRPQHHSFVIGSDESADLLCANVDLDHQAGNPLTKALPDMLLIPFHSMPTLLPTLELLFNEAAKTQCGRQAAIDRLAGYLLIQILRYVLDSSGTAMGLMAGLADKRLAHAISAMHEHPRQPWPLQKLAATAGMSRARFAVHFRETVGMTPGEYLARWRLTLAQNLLKQNKPLEMVADSVGYGGAAALSRAFKAYTGQSPREWKRKIEHEHHRPPPSPLLNNEFK